tara:strand:+ start:1591 stop:2328 length:738 start_codon:yes stop_codon:yes gene_type:complete
MAERIQMDTGVTGPEAPVETTEEQAVDRPEWLPEKFQSPEDMAKAYGELESKMGEEPESSENEQEYEEDHTQEVEGVAITETAMEEFSNEFYEKGDLSEETLDRIQDEFGISKEIAKAYVDGQKALVEQAQQTIFAEVGGQENYQEMLEWAKTNLTESEINAYDSAIVSNDIETARMVAKGLHAQYIGSEGINPSLAHGSAASVAGTEGYGSWQQVSADMAKPEYKNDPAFREMVKNKLSVSRLT